MGAEWFVILSAKKCLIILLKSRAVNQVVRSDITVSAFLDSVGGYRHKERRDKLVDLLDINLDWHMHNISDGERRRVQLCFGLMAPFNVLLLDEVWRELNSRISLIAFKVTVDLDVLVRDDLLKFLKADSQERTATILCMFSLCVVGNQLTSFVADATHIFDGLNDFPTHVAHMRLGTLLTPVILWPPSNSTPLTCSHPSTSLYKLALNWLKEDRECRRELEKHGEVCRGARRNEVISLSLSLFVPQ